jgi:hypothetical protein
MPGHVDDIVDPTPLVSGLAVQSRTC